MNKIRRILCLLLTFFVLTGIVSATTCLEVPYPKTPISHVCGIVRDRLGQPVAQAKVQILRNDSLSTEVLTEVQTDKDGRFSFEHLKSGTYRILFIADGFSHFGFPIQVQHSDTKCKQTLEVLMCLGSSCDCSATLKKI